MSWAHSIISGFHKLEIMREFTIRYECRIKDHSFNQTNWFVDLQSHMDGQRFRVRRWIADQMPDGSVDRSSPLVIVHGVDNLRDVVVKLTLDWLEKLYSAGQALHPTSCDILPLMNLLIDVLTSESVEEPTTEGLIMRSRQRGVTMNLSFFLDYLVESIEFNFGTEVFAFMEFVAECSVIASNQGGVSSRGSQCIRNVTQDVFLAHILLSTRKLLELTNDLKHVGLGVSFEIGEDHASSDCLKKLSKWTRLDCLASRRAQRYEAQRNFITYLINMVSNKIDPMDPNIIDVSLRLLLHKDVFRREMLRRLLSFYLNLKTLDEGQRDTFITAFQVLNSKV